MFIVTASTVSAENTGKIKNVIHMIPDGGGMEPFWLADAVKQAGGIGGVSYPTGTSSNPGVVSNFDDYAINNTEIVPYLADLMGTDLDAVTQFYNKNADGEYEFIYLTEGEHQLVLKNIGDVNCRVE